MDRACHQLRCLFFNNFWIKRNQFVIYSRCRNQRNVVRVFRVKAAILSHKTSKKTHARNATLSNYHIAQKRNYRGPVCWSCCLFFARLRRNVNYLLPAVILRFFNRKLPPFKEPIDQFVFDGAATYRRSDCRLRRKPAGSVVQRGVLASVTVRGFGVFPFVLYVLVCNTYLIGVVIDCASAVLEVVNVRALVLSIILLTNRPHKFSSKKHSNCKLELMWRQRER